MISILLYSIKKLSKIKTEINRTLVLAVEVLIYSRAQFIDRFQNIGGNNLEPYGANKLDQ